MLKNNDYLSIGIRIKGLMRKLTSLYSSLRPDNIDLPSNISLEMTLGDQLSITLTSDMRNIFRLKNTLDDIFRSIECILDLLEALDSNY